MPFNTVQTRAPKQFGDFGEGLVTYTLIRKGFEVAKVDHVGADLIAEHEGRRYAISVKSRMYRSGSMETRGVLLKQDDIDKLEFFSAQFGMAFLFAHVCSIADDKVIHLVMSPVSIVSLVMSETKEGYRRDIRHLIINDMVDYPCWRDEKMEHLSFENASLAGSNQQQGTNFARYNSPMSITEIKTKIERLPDAELADLAQWLEEFQADAWDRQIARDVKAGRFDATLKQVDEQAEAELCEPL